MISLVTSAMAILSTISPLVDLQVERTAPLLTLHATPASPRRYASVPTSEPPSMRSRADRRHATSSEWWTCRRAQLGDKADERQRHLKRHRPYYRYVRLPDYYLYICPPVCHVVCVAFW